MKYALLGYVSREAWDSLPPDDKHALHKESHAEHQALASVSASLIAHYRFRPPQQATTVRLSGGEIVLTEGASTERSEALRALYLIESDDRDAVLDLASRLPALRGGATVEVWPLAEPNRHPA